MVAPSSIPGRSTTTRGTQSATTAATVGGRPPGSSGTAIAPIRIAPISAAAASRPSGQRHHHPVPGPHAEPLEARSGAAAGPRQVSERPGAVIVDDCDRVPSPCEVALDEVDRGVRRHTGVGHGPMLVPSPSGHAP